MKNPDSSIVFTVSPVSATEDCNSFRAVSWWCSSVVSIFSFWGRSVIDRFTAVPYFHFFIDLTVLRNIQWLGNLLVSTPCLMLVNCSLVFILSLHDPATILTNQKLDLPDQIVFILQKKQKPLDNTQLICNLFMRFLRPFSCNHSDDNYIMLGEYFQNFLFWIILFRWLCRLWSTVKIVK